jgi:hypothetical protein
MAAALIAASLPRSTQDLPYGAGMETALGQNPASFFAAARLMTTSPKGVRTADTVKRLEFRQGGESSARNC